MQPIDAYGILKLDASATAEDIRRAYHQAARDHHPDRRKAGESDMHFIQVQRAWEALREPDARRQYDAQKRLETMLEEQALASLSDVTLDDMTHIQDPNGNYWQYPCRCGDWYELTEDQRDEGINIVACSSCTFAIRILEDIPGINKERAHPPAS